MIDGAQVWYVDALWIRGGRADAQWLRSNYCEIQDGAEIRHWDIFWHFPDF